MTKKRASPIKLYVFTDNTLVDWSKLYGTGKFQCISYAEESAPTTGKKHYQGFLQMKKRTRINALIKMVPGVHFERMLGSVKDNIVYINKENDAVTFGKVTLQGGRSDLKRVYDMLKEGKSEDQILETEPAAFIRYGNGIKRAKLIVDKALVPLHRNVHVSYYWGPTRVGKTYEALHSDESVFHMLACDLSKDWFDGYDGENLLVIDDYDNQVSVMKLMSLTDNYRLRLNVKGGHTWAKWTKIIITSNIPPQELHLKAKECHRQALFARIDLIKHFPIRVY